MAAKRRAGSTSVARRRLLAVDGPRPVALALEVLRKRHGIMVSYEDLLYLENGAAHFLPHLRRPPGPDLAEGALVPESAQLALTYPVNDLGEPADLRSLLEAIISKSDEREASSSFEILGTDGAPIVAAAARPVASRPLDCPIRIDKKRWNGIALLKRIAAAVTAGTGLQVYLATAPFHFVNRRITFGHEGPAREVLRDALQRLTSNGRQLGYHALYDATVKWFMINVRISPPAQLDVVSQCPNPPSGETGTSSGRKGYDYVLRFDVQLDPSTTNFKGRTVQEVSKGIVDNCCVQGSGCPPYTLDGGQWKVVDHNRFIGPDTIGIFCWVKKLLDSYHTKPCMICVQQGMLIDCQGGWYEYTTNGIQIVVTPGGAVDVRRGKAAGSIPVFNC